ncbi:MAG TPA: universal stress protein [Micropepsaceae bacterium]|nr:universal stress protein [Micropepsaceae bacterium]
MFRKIAIAHDGSDGAAKAFSAAVTLAATHGAELHMVCVEATPQIPATVDEVIEDRQDANRQFDKLCGPCRSEAKRKEVDLHAHVLYGHAVQKICEFVQYRNCDLLIAGYMGHSALYNRLIGSTTERLVEHAPCAVLVVK